MFAAHIPTVTLATSGLLSLIYVALSARVVMGRAAGGIMMGEGKNPLTSSGEPSDFLIRVRSHANFAEYVPLCLILIAALELRAGPSLLVKVLAAILVLARLAHPVGMAMPAPNPWRVAGFTGTMLVLVVAGLAAIATLFQVA